MAKLDLIPPWCASGNSAFHCEGAETSLIFLAPCGNLFATLLLAPTKLTTLCTLPKLVALFTNLF